MNHKRYITRLAIIASLDTYTSIDSKRINTIWSKYELDILNSIKNQGARSTLERYKESYIFLRNLSLELSVQPIPWCKADSNGIPKTLWSLRPLIKGNRYDKRIALCIARSYELIVLPVDYHPISIDETGTHKCEKFNDISSDFKQWLKQFIHKYPKYIGSLTRRDSYEPQVFTTLSKGPNGPAVSTAHLDAYAVVNNKELYSSITLLNQVLQQSWITKWMELNSLLPNTGEQYHTGRLGFSAEPGGKTRVFAIGDYWSQTSLKVIQITLDNILKTISTDSTHNQEKGFKSLLKECEGYPTYCFDLTAASDRIPAEMQSIRLNLLLENLGDAWLKVMKDRDFFVKATGEKLRWEVGQPLGLLSSFPSFSLWHHDIIQYSYYLVRKKNGFKNPIKFFTKYRLLGDDVVIFNKAVADVYQHLITDIFKININASKSIIGNKRNSQIEFLKRLSIRGLEMSSIKRNILTKSSLQSILELVDIMIERDFLEEDSAYNFCNLDFLDHRSQDVLNFFIWVRSNCKSPFIFKRLNLPYHSEKALKGFLHKYLISRRAEILKYLSNLCVYSQKDIMDIRLLLYLLWSYAYELNGVWIDIKKEDFSNSFNQIAYALDSRLTTKELVSRIRTLCFFFINDKFHQFYLFRTSKYITREEFNSKLLNLRRENIKSKIQEVDKMLSNEKSIDIYYKSLQVPHCRRSLGLEGYENNNLKLHPIVWAINQTGMDLSIALSMLEFDENPTVLPVEYLPIVSLKSYFFQPKKASKEYLSKLIISVYKAQIYK